MPTQKIDPKVIFASDAPAIDKPPVFSDKTKGWDVSRANDGRPEIKQMNKMQQDTDLKILWLNENAVLPYDLSIDYPEGAVTLKDGSFKQLSSGLWIEFLDDFADKDAVKRGIANRYDSSLTYNSGERVVLTNGDIVKSTVDGNTNDPNVDMTGWLSTGDIGEVESIADLLTIPNPKNGSRIFVKGAQGGWFEYNESKKLVNNGITIFNGWVRITLETCIYPEWAGARGFSVDESFDNTVAIQKCLDFCSPTQWDTSVAVMNKKGAARYELRLIDKYRITDTLWVGAYQSISGNVKLNFNSEISGAIIFADFNDQLKPAISSSNWRTGGVRVPFDGTTSGAEYDAGLISHTPSLKLTDFSIVTNKRQYIGLRVQNAPLSEIKVSCYGFDYGVLTNASWDSDFNCFTKHYKCGFLADIDGNNITVDGYYNAIEGTPISAKNLVNFFGSDTDLDPSLNDLNTQFGFVMRYSYGFSSKSIVAEHNDVGVVTANASAVYGSIYTEGNRKAGYVGFANGDGVQIGLHTGAFDYAGLTLGSGGHVNINSIQKTSNNPYFGNISIYNTTINMYAETNHYHAYANYINDKRTFYVDKTGSDLNVGMLDYTPLLSLDEAINRVKQSRSFKDRSKVVSNQEAAKIYILDNGEYTIDNKHILNCNLTIIGIGTSKPSISLNKNLILTNSNVTFDNCSIIKNNVDGDYNNAIVTRFGSNSVTLSNSDINLVAGGILACDYNGASECSLIFDGSNISGDSSKYLVSGNYDDTSPHLINVIRARGRISPAILNRSDKGVAIPGLWKGKILGL